MAKWDDDEVVGRDKNHSFGDQDVVEESPRFIDYATGFGSGVNVGLANLAGAPADISNAIASMVGMGTEEIPLGSRWIKRMFGHLERIPGAGDPFYKGPETAGGRILHRAGEEIGATAPVAGMILKSAGRTAQLMRQTPRVQATQLKPKDVVREGIIEPVGRAPGKATTGELVAATGAGVGAGVAMEALPGSKAAETTGQLLGGVAPALTQSLYPMNIGYRLLKRIIGRFSPAHQKEQAVQAVVKMMGSLPPESMEGLRQAQRLSEKVPGFQPTVAESTRNQGLILQQQHLDDEATGAILDASIRRRKANEAAIESFRDKAVPASDVDPSYVVDTATSRAKVVGDTIEGGVGRVVQKKRDIADSIPTIDKISSGKMMREGIIQARAAKSAEMSILAEDLDLNIDVTDAFHEWKKVVRKKYQLESRFQDREGVRPEALTKITSDRGKIKTVDGKAVEQPKETTFLDIKSLRESISDDIIDASGSAIPNRRLVRTLVRLKKDVDNFIEQEMGAAGDTYAEFRRRYRDEYIAPFESGAIFKAKNKDGTGFFRTLDERVGDLFLDTPSATRQYVSIFKDDPVMMSQLDGSLLDRMRNTISPDGLVDDAKLYNWTKRNQAVVNEVPGFGDKVSSVQSAQLALNRRQVSLVARKKQFEDNALVRAINSYTKGNIEADKVINDAIKSPRRMSLLIKSISKDNDATGGLRRLLWDKATSQGSENAIRFMNDNRKSLELVFNKQHLKDMEDVAMMRAMVESVPTPRGQAYVPRPLSDIEKRLGMPIPQAGTRWYALKSGRLSKSYLFFEIGRNILYGKAKLGAEALFRDALYDPQVARALAAGGEVGTISESAAKRLGARAFALGLPFLREEDNRGQ